MPTISGIRRRGYTPEAIRLFAERVGISKADNNIDMSVLEDCAREVIQTYLAICLFMRVVRGR
jgi:glutaminyl-tRNA synthetase